MGTYHPPHGTNVSYNTPGDVSYCVVMEGVTYIFCNVSRDTYHHTKGHTFPGEGKCTGYAHNKK